MRAYVLLLTCALAAGGCASNRLSRTERETARIERAADDLLSAIRVSSRVRLPNALQVEEVALDPDGRTLDIRYGRDLENLWMRSDSIHAWSERLRHRLGRRYADYRLTLYAGSQALDTLVPNRYRTPGSMDAARRPSAQPAARPVVRRTGEADLREPEAGLFGRHIALWHSHGWYWERSLGRWEWQRARLFTTVEDLAPGAFVLPYLVPMLERAGAEVHLPRERDIQTAMVVVDNDSPGDSTRYREMGPVESGGTGFGVGSPPYQQENPFRLGSTRWLPPGREQASVQWRPRIPTSGRYAVYVSYGAHDAAGLARYAVHHSGGVTSFEVDQRMSAGTWVYLGTFHFHADPDLGAVADSVGGSRVELFGPASGERHVVTADAVRFGGGMGLISRGGRPSGRPRFVEGARYALQYAGMPDTLVYRVTSEEDGDYRDDYQSRGEWVNYLRGAPYGPNKHLQETGLGIPIDLSLAFHTDAGVRRDTTVGTLMIFATTALDSARVFPDDMSRWANRDFGDILQTQIVDDLRSLYEPNWTRRALWDRRYSEAVRPNVPSALLELLSHQNFYDMRYGLDPRFRFDTARAIYKGMLRFLETQYGYETVVQPLPPDHFEAHLTGGDMAELSWRLVDDPLEDTARPDAYVLYTARGPDSGYDGGRLVRATTVRVEIEAGLIHRFRVAAWNQGGESMPSEELSVGIPAVADPEASRGRILIVNGFDRVSGPAVVDTEAFAGFAHWDDQGVPDGLDIAYTGRQFNFARRVDWADDDAPGFGASYGEQETRPVAGNTFDFPAKHGHAVLAAGYAFSSSSDEAFSARPPSSDRYDVVDWIAGEERTTRYPNPHRPAAFEVFPLAQRAALTGYLASGGRLLISGAHIGTDAWERSQRSDSLGRVFAEQVLGFRLRTNHAAAVGGFEPTPGTAWEDILPADGFNTVLTDSLYAVEAPDGIEPAAGGQTILRYVENNISAGVMHRGDNYRVASIGFPLEAVVNPGARQSLIVGLLNALMAPWVAAEPSG